MRMLAVISVYLHCISRVVAAAAAAVLHSIHTKLTQTDGTAAEQRDCDERALLTRLRFRFARLPVTAPGQQVQQQSDQRQDEQRRRYGGQNAQTL